MWRLCRPSDECGVATNTVKKTTILPRRGSTAAAAKRFPTLLLFLCGCAIQGQPAGTLAPQSRVTIVVESHNWTAAAVRVMCEGRLLGTVRGVAFNRIVRERVHLSGCQDIHFEIDRLAASSYAHPETVTVSEGDTVVLDIAPVLPHTFLRRDDPADGEH